jgi:hypothetical protein
MARQIGESDTQLAIKFRCDRCGWAGEGREVPCVGGASGVRLCTQKGCLWPLSRVPDETKRSAEPKGRKVGTRKKFQNNT